MSIRYRYGVEDSYVCMYGQEWVGGQKTAISQSDLSTAISDDAVHKAECCISSMKMESNFLYNIYMSDEVYPCIPSTDKDRWLSFQANHISWRHTGAKEAATIP